MRKESLVKPNVAEDVIADDNEMLWGVCEKQVHQVGTIGCDKNVGILEEIALLSKSFVPESDCGKAHGGEHVFKLSFINNASTLTTFIVVMIFAGLPIPFQVDQALRMEGAIGGDLEIGTQSVESGDECWVVVPVETIEMHVMQCLECMMCIVLKDKHLVRLDAIAKDHVLYKVVISKLWYAKEAIRCGLKEF